ncbi:HAD family hydrolase [Barnesiella propionica]|uniref:HAD family hydrolase n=1 Tax=Barnesiella propionica TaxID=2981781 RepID=UPI0011C7EFEE|nr:HAD family hydrolase [Barnesiella propionica]MCU6768916.1 HAD family hydrolase [Barnesiella propionica]
MALKVVAFDADDTLWVNEPFFQEVEKEYVSLLEDYGSADDISQALFATEMKNLNIYGYGAKGFTLSMIETALEVSGNRLAQVVIARILELGKSLLNMPIELIDGIEDTLSYLKQKYFLVVATKGDITDQQNKLERSGLVCYFHHIEIMGEKNEDGYARLFSRLNVKPEQFLMVGNSVKSDILPVLNLKAQAIHVPFHSTWEHERMSISGENSRYRSINSVTELMNIL